MPMALCKFVHVLLRLCRFLTAGDFIPHGAFNAGRPPEDAIGLRSVMLLRVLQCIGLLQLRGERLMGSSNPEELLLEGSHMGVGASMHGSVTSF